MHFVGRPQHRRHADAGGAPVVLHAADVRWPDLLPELETRVDLVLCNPPYVPDGTPVPPEVAYHDPPGAVFAGPDGLEIIRPLVTASRRCCATAAGWRSSTMTPTPTRSRRSCAAAASCHDVVEHPDLTGRPRFAPPATAR